MRFRFVNVQDGAGNPAPHGINPVKSPNLFEADGSSDRHNLCGTQSWMNGLSLWGFHPKLDGHTAEAGTIAPIIATLDWSGLNQAPTTGNRGVTGEVPARSSGSNATSGGGGTPTVQLVRGPAAPQGYRYAVSINGFGANSTVAVTCYDSVSADGFYSFRMGTDGNGAGHIENQCYSADGPDHWVTANGVTSNHVTWGGSAPPPPAPPAPAPAPPVPTPPAPPAPRTYPETSGGLVHTWTNYTNAGGTEGPSVPANTTIQISCKLQGFRVPSGNTWWYRIAQAPWNNTYYGSADAFYNNGQTSGSLRGTPFVDPNVRDC